MTIGPGDDTLRELLLVRPDEFVAARNDLVKSLRADKRRDDADVVAKLRRPSWPDHALNVVTATEPNVTAEFVAAASRLRAAQTAAVDGYGAALGPAMRDFRDAQRPVVAAANRVLRSRGRPADGPALSARLVEIAAGEVDDPSIDLLVAAIGNAPSELSASRTPDGGVDPGARSDARPPRRGGRRGKASASTTDAGDGPTATEVAALRKAVRRAERDHKSAQTAVDRATARLDKANAALADAQQEADDAAAALAEADAAAAASAAALDDARRAADQPAKSGG